MAKIQHENELGPFIYARFRREGEREPLKEETFARLAYLATYLNYDNCLMLTERTPLDKRGISEVMGLSPATFKRFWKEATDAGYLVMKDDGTIGMGWTFHRGKAGITGWDAAWIKVFIRQMRTLYKSIKPTRHHLLGAVFCMLPCVNIKYNVLCLNPFEENIEMVEPIDIPTFCRMLGKAESNADDFRKAYRSIKFSMDGKEHRFCSILYTDDGRELIYVNPRVMFMGDDWKCVEGLMLLFDNKPKRGRAKRDRQERALAETRAIIEGRRKLN